MRASELARLKARLAHRGITVTPKHTTLASEIRRLQDCFGPICIGCLRPIVKGSGNLTLGRCGVCRGKCEALSDDLRAPHSAA